MEYLGCYERCANDLAYKLKTLSTLITISDGNGLTTAEGCMGLGAILMDCADMAKEIAGAIEHATFALGAT